MGTYDTTREHFDVLVKKYKEYIALYRIFNNGSTEGITTFDRFYWQFTYVSKYSDPKNIENRGY